MKTMMGMCSAVSLLCLTATGVIADDRFSGKLSLTPKGNCPATLALADVSVPVDIALPDAAAVAQPAVQNRFRYNFTEAIQPAPRVIITGEIVNYAAPGCILAFKGDGE